MTVSNKNLGISQSQLSQTQPRNAINFTTQLVFAATDVPQRFPALIVPHGLSVALRGVVGGTVNTNAAYIATTRDELTEAASGRYTISPESQNTVVSFPVDNLGQIWAMGTKGDGLIASVMGASIG
jgi:hypothetical protein